MAIADLTLQRPALLTDERIIGLSTDDNPVIGPDGGALEVGQEWFHEDTGRSKYWDGSAWYVVDFNQKFNQLIALQFEIRDLLAGANE